MRFQAKAMTHPGGARCSAVEGRLAARVARVRRQAALAVVAAVAAGVIAAPAQAATIVVGVRADVVADDGQCSLREAVGSANTGLRSGASPGECPAGESPPVVDRIVLKRGKYKLTRGGPGEDGNAGGDLDVTQSVEIVGQGRNRSFIRSDVGDPLVRGDGDRLFHVDPSANGGVDVTFRGLTLMRGDVSCTGAECVTGGSAVETTGDGTLVFDGCGIRRNDVTCFGDDCGTSDGGAAIRSYGGGTVEIRATVIKRNTARCADPRCDAGGAAIVVYDDAGVGRSDFRLEGGVVADNSSACEGVDCGAGGIVAVEAQDVAVVATRFLRNDTRCAGEDCTAETSLELFARAAGRVEGVSLVRNVQACQGASCRAHPLLDGQASGAGVNVVLRRVSATATTTACQGDGCAVSPQIELQASPGNVALEDVELGESKNECTGASCLAAGLVEMFAPSGIADAQQLDVVQGSVACGGDDCRADDIVVARAPLVVLQGGQTTLGRVSCVGAGCDARNVLHVSSEVGAEIFDQLLAGNAIACSGAECVSGRILQFFGSSLLAVRSEIGENAVSCIGRFCDVRAIVGAVATTSIRIAEASVVDNLLRCEGERCDATEMLRLDAGTTVEVDLADVRENSSSCAGASCVGDAVLAISGDTATVKSSSFVSNRSECDGTGCSLRFGGALRNLARDAEIEGASFVDNRSDGFGAAIYNAPTASLRLTNVSLTGNLAGLRRTIPFGGAGGAIYNDSANGAKGTLRLVDTQIRGNRALLAGGVANEGTIATLTRTAIADNQPTNCVNFGGTGCP